MTIEAWPSHASNMIICVLIYCGFWFVNLQCACGWALRDGTTTTTTTTEGHTCNDFPSVSLPRAVLDVKEESFAVSQTLQNEVACIHALVCTCCVRIHIHGDEVTLLNMMIYEAGAFGLFDQHQLVQLVFACTSHHQGLESQTLCHPDGTRAERHLGCRTPICESGRNITWEDEAGVQVVAEVHEVGVNHTAQRNVGMHKRPC